MGVPLGSTALGQDPTPGKYGCTVAHAVGLQTDKETGKRVAGEIRVADAEAKFSVTIEEHKQLPEDRCFSSSAVDDLKKLRSGEQPGDPSRTRFYRLHSYFRSCLARFKLTMSGGPIGTYYAGKSAHLFTAYHEFGYFRLFNDLSFVWDLTNFDGDYYLLEGKCEKMRD